MRPFWIPILLLQKVWDPMISSIIVLKNLHMLSHYVIESRSSVLFCLWEMSGIIPTPVGQPDLLPFFRDPGVTQVQGPSDGCRSVGCNCSLPFCGRCCVINSGHSATRSKSEHQDSAVKKNWQWCTATLHSTGALPNEFESDTHSPKKAKHWLMTYNITAALIRYFQ